jgi:hypothetical protein
MRLLFSLTLFCSAVLLFLIQPMLGKMILPKLGGTPAVWNTCMVFFQALLLAGYAYAHYTTRGLGVRRQAAWHLPLLLLPFLALPIAIGESWVPPREANPIPWVLGLLFVTAGLPFFVVSTSAPLLQRWFAGTGHRDARDPYFLYSASNLGSMLALLGYPVALEPLLRLADQSFLWMVVYSLFVLLAAGCAVALWRSPRPATEPVAGPPEPPGPVPTDVRQPATGSAEGFQAKPHSFASKAGRSEHLSPLRVLHWIGLAFVPSSLMLAVTTFLTTDIAAIPLLWVIPLTLYLLTFIIVFAGKPRLPHPLTRLLLVVLILVLLVLMLAGYTPRLGVTAAMSLHLGLLFLVSLVCHGELARLRPGPDHLTGYYLAMSFGGVLGGLFNALVAPVVFTSLAEYPLTLILACLLLPGTRATKERGRSAKLAPRIGSLLLAVVGFGLAVGGAFWLIDFYLQSTVHHWSDLFGVNVWLINMALKFGIIVALVLGFLSRPVRADLLAAVGFGLAAVAAVWLADILQPAVRRWSDLFGVEVARINTVLKFGLPAALCLSFLGRPVRLGLAVGAFVLVGSTVGQLRNQILHEERGFFGVLQVRTGKLTEGGKELEYRYLLHGNTTHGLELADPVRRREPLAYYHKTGPIGQLMDALSGSDAKRRVAVTGLGVGALAGYAEPGQEWTFYEIDPGVIRLAEDERYFHFLADARARGVRVGLEPGDARLRLVEAPDGGYDLIFMDAFSSDAVPVHLLTREALELYVQKLADGGLLVFNITNRYADLEPVLAAVAHDPRLGLAGLTQYDHDASIFPRKSPSGWVVLARRESDLGKLRENPKWKPLSDPGKKPWTDDFSNLLGALRFFR